MCDNHHYNLEEEERLVITTTVGTLAQREGCHYDTMAKMTVMVTSMQDRLQDRLVDMRTTTSSDIIRPTDRLQELRLKLLAFFSQKCLYFMANAKLPNRPAFALLPVHYAFSAFSLYRVRIADFEIRPTGFIVTDLG